jgi:hypothetical protein
MKRENEPTVASGALTESQRAIEEGKELHLT